MYAMKLAAPRQAGADFYKHRMRPEVLAKSCHSNLSLGARWTGHLLFGSPDAGGIPGSRGAQTLMLP